MVVSGVKGFFAIDLRCFSEACDIGMNEAVAYLVLGCGTGRNNQDTSWSAQALHKHTGITWERGRAAIEELIRGGLVCIGEGHTKSRPRYRLLPHNATGKKANPDDDMFVWLPNSVVMGTLNGELSPISRLRSAADFWALRLYVELYRSQNLRDDGGIAPRVLRASYERKQICESGIYTIWAFRPRGRWHIDWSGPFAVQKKRPQAKDHEHPVWESVRLLRDMGLLAFIPHLIESDSAQAEIIHPLGIGANGEEEIETAIGSEAREAAERMCAEWAIERAENEGFENFCPVLRTLPNVQLVGIARLRYRPHTRRTAAWYAHLRESTEIAIGHYRALNGGSVSVVEEFERKMIGDLVF
jgi:hypothetical protein